MTATGDTRLSAVTIGAIAILAYCAANVVHEGLGHGGACFAVGGRAGTLDAIFFHCALEETPAQARIVAAGGAVANVVFAALGLVALRLWRGAATTGRYLLWLFTALNVLMPCGYVLFSGILGVGDGAAVTENLQPAWLFRALLTAVGAALYFGLAPRLILPGFLRFVGVGRDEHLARATRLSLLPYAVGGSTFVLAGAFNPASKMYILTSAVAASFGGTSLLAWSPRVAVKKMPDGAGEPAEAFPASWPWWIAALVMLVIFVALLGPGLRIRE